MQLLPCLMNWVGTLFKNKDKSRLQCSTEFGLACVLSTPILIPTPVTATRGVNMQFLVPQMSVNVHMYSFPPSTTRIWNHLPQQAVSAPSLETYKLLFQKFTM